MTNVTLLYQPVFTLGGSPLSPQIVHLLFVTNAELLNVARAAVRVALNRAVNVPITVADVGTLLDTNGRFSADVSGLRPEYKFLLQLQPQPQPQPNSPNPAPVVLTAFPMLPDATLTVGATTTNFNSFECDSTYLSRLNQRLALAAQVDNASPLPVPADQESLTQLILSDYFQILLTQYITALTKAGTAASSIDDVSIDQNLLGGIASRFLLHGTRLPESSTSDTLQPLFQLTGQQQPHQQSTFKLTLGDQSVSVDPADPRFPAIVPANPPAPASPSSALVDAAATFDPTANILALTSFPPYAIIGKMFNFGKPVQTNGTAGKLLYPLPQAFRRHLQDHPGIPTNVSVAGNKTKNMSWATRVDFTLRAALDPETGIPVPNLYGIFSRNQDIASDLHGVAAADLTHASIQLLYATKGGLVSDQSPVARLIKSNLSAQAGTTVVASAKLTEPTNFLLLLTECIAVEDGGFFLSYTAESTSTFSQFFAKTSDATITILVQGVAPGIVQPFHNCGTVDSSAVPDTDKETLTILPPSDQFAAGKTIDSLANATNRGLLTAGVTITIGEVARTILPGDDFLGLSMATGASLDQIRDAAVTANALTTGATIQVHRDWVVRRTTMAPGNTGFRMLLPDPTGDKSPAKKLQQLFSLLSFRLTGNQTFNASVEGLPSSPSNGDNQHKNPPRGSPWTYQQILSIANFVKGPADPYAGVPATATFEFHFNDIFGNEFPGRTRTLDIPVRYRDDVFSLAQWPSLIATFEFSGSGSTPMLQIDLGFDPKRYDHLADPTIPARRGQEDLRRYQAIVAQISRSDVTLSAATTLGSLGTATVTDKFRQFAQNAVSFLVPVNSAEDTLATAKAKLAATDPADQAARTAAQAKVDAALAASATTAAAAAPLASISLAITIGTLPVVFEVGATVTIERAATSIDALFADSASVKSSISALRPNYDVTGKPTLNDFAASFETAFGAQRLKLLAGPRMDNSQLLHAVQFRTPLLDYTPAANASFFGLPPLSTELFSGSVPIASYIPGTVTPGPATTVTFRGIDLDVWGRAFLHDLDLFLSPKFAGQIDDQAYEIALQAKFDLAACIAAHVTRIVDPTGTVTPTQVTSEVALAAAVEDFRERLLVHIADAYSIDTIIQLPVTVKYPAGQPPASIDLRPRAASTTTAAFSITDSSLDLNDGPGTLNFLFDSRVESQFRKITLDTFTLEPRSITVGASDPDHYIFVRPQVQDGISPAVVVPVPLRSYPIPPSLIAQRATPGVRPANPNFADLKSYTYSFTYSFDNAAQDEIIDHSQFNVAGQTADAVDTPSPVTPAGSLPAALARYASIAPALARDFFDPVKGAAAFTVFANQAKAIASAWKTWHPNVTEAPAQEQASTNEAVAGGFQHTVSELDVVTHQNAIGGLHVTRNRDLLDKATTNQAFVYTLPNVTFPNALVPLVRNETNFDIATLDSTASTIRGHLAALFKSMLEVDETSPAVKGRAVRIAVAYEFVLAGSGADVIEAHVPVVLKPKFTFDPTVDFGVNGVCAALESELNTWKTTNAVPSGQGSWIFDVSVYSTIAGSGSNAPPLLELTNLRLRA